MTIYIKVVAIAVITAMSVTLANAQLPKVELKKLTIPVSAMRHGLKKHGQELRSWRLSNLIDFISSGKKVVQDATNPNLNKVSKVKGK